MKRINKFSLLWPEGIDPEKYANQEKLSQRCVANLGLDMIARELSYDEKHYYKVKKLMLNLCDNPEVISYRLDILQDFVRNPELAAGLREIFEYIEQIRHYKQPGKKLSADNYQAVAWRLRMLDIYVTCMQMLNSLIQDKANNFKSTGLQKLSQYLKNMVESDLFQNLNEKLPDLRARFANLSCVTIGINLNARLEPEEAIFLSVEKKPFIKRSFLSRLFNRDSNQDKIHGVSQFQNILSRDKEVTQLQLGIFRELNDVFQKVLTPIEKTISRFINYRESVLIKWRREFSFYIGCTRFIKKMRDQGLAMCKPQVIIPGKRKTKIQDLTDLTLALGLMEEADKEDKQIKLGAEIVPNDLRFDDQGRIYILTGPNQGGKTTFTRAVGIAQVLLQMGMYVPGSKGALSPVDWIHTHFTEEEKPQVKDGRLGEESRRLSEIFYKATPYSLLLLNESLSSTSPGEGLYLLKNIIKGIKSLRSRAIFTTHLHSLAEIISEINEEVDTDSKVDSLVAEVERSEDEKIEAKRTFKIKSKKPQGKSYARDVAYKYGISYEQILQTIRNRGSVRKDITDGTSGG